MRAREFLKDDAYQTAKTDPVYWQSYTPQEQAEWQKRRTMLESRANRIYQRLVSIMPEEDRAAVRGLRVTVPITGEMAWASADLEHRQLTMDLGAFWDLSDDCVAYVLGHEIGHFVYENKNKGYWRKRIAPATNRQHEMDADVYGALLAFKLGYNSSRAFDQFTRSEQNEPWDPKAPHYPSVGQRKANMAKSINQYKQQQAQAQQAPGPGAETPQPQAPAAQQPQQQEPVKDMPTTPQGKEDIKGALLGIEKLTAYINTNPQVAQASVPMPSALA